MSVIAIITDFGVADHFVAAMKGVILSIAPDAKIVDITHEAEAFDVSRAAFSLASCYREFPPGTVFLAVVDPGVGSSRRALVAETGGRYFVAPDNGLLTLALTAEDLSAARFFELKNEQYQRREVSSTFHGRDIFAPAAAHIAMGVSPSEFGPAVDDPVTLSWPQPSAQDGRLAGEIIHIDRFGNLITNFRGEHLTTGAAAFSINGREFDALLKHSYTEGADAGIFAIEGSAGFVEISAYMSSAAEKLNAKAGDRVELIAKDNAITTGKP